MDDRTDAPMHPTSGIVEAEPYTDAPWYRSEAFAEDLMDDDLLPDASAPRANGGWLFAAPLSAALVGTAMSLLQQVA